MRFVPSFLQKIDRYLLVNYPIIWETKAHFVAFYSFFFANIILFACGFLAYTDVDYVPNLPKLHYHSNAFLIGITILAMVFYAFYLGFFQNRIRYYTFSQVLLRYGLMAFIVFSFLSNMVMYFWGVTAYIHTKYDIAQTREDLYYIRKMEVAENIITRLHYVPLEQKKQVLEGLKKSHFNQNNEVNILLETTQKLDLLSQKMHEETKKDTNFCEKFIENYKKENPNKKIVLNATINYTGHNQRGQNHKYSSHEERQESVNAEVETKTAIEATIPKSEEEQKKSNPFIRTYLHILQEDFINQNFKSVFIKDRLVRDNVPYNLAQYEDVPFILELEKIQKILGKYEKLTKNFDADYQTIEKLENILSFSFGNEAHAKYIPYQNQNEDVVGDLFEKNAKNDYGNFVRPFGMQEKELQVQELASFQNLFNKIKNEKSFFNVLKAKETTSGMNHTIYLSLSLVIASFVSLGLMFSKFYNFKNLLVSVIIVVGYFSFGIGSYWLHPASALFFLGISAILLMIFGGVFLSAIRNQSQMFWIICAINLFFIINLLRLIYLIGNMTSYIEYYESMWPFLEILFFGLFAVFAFWVYTFCNNLTKKPSQTI